MILKWPFFISSQLSRCWQLEWISPRIRFSMRRLLRFSNAFGKNFVTESVSRGLFESGSVSCGKKFPIVRLNSRTTRCFIRELLLIVSQCLLNS